MSKKRRFGTRESTKFSKRFKLKQLPLSTKFNGALRALGKVQLTQNEAFVVKSVRNSVNENTYKKLLLICKNHGIRERDINKLF